MKNFVIEYNDEYYSKEQYQERVGMLVLQHSVLGEIELPGSYEIRYCDFSVYEKLRKKQKDEGWKTSTVHDFLETVIK